MAFAILKSGNLLKSFRLKSKVILFCKRIWNYHKHDSTLNKIRLAKNFTVLLKDTIIKAEQDK